MTEQKLTYKERQAQAKRIKYWRIKLENAGLMYFVLDDDNKLKEIYREWQEAQGKPVIQDEDIKSPELDTTSVSEFYQIKKAWEKEGDREWIRKVNLERERGEPDTHSARNEAIRSGISPLLYDIMSHNSKEFTIKSDIDKYVTRRHKKKKEKKEKSTWNF